MSNKSLVATHHCLPPERGPRSAAAVRCLRAMAWLSRGRSSATSPSHGSHRTQHHWPAPCFLPSLALRAHWPLLTGSLPPPLVFYPGTGRKRSRPVSQSPGWSSWRGQARSGHGRRSAAWRVRAGAGGSEQSRAGSERCTASAPSAGGAETGLRSAGSRLYAARRRAAPSHWQRQSQSQRERQAESVLGK